jgi:MFS family permease
MFAGLGLAGAGAALLATAGTGTSLGLIIVGSVLLGLCSLAMPAMTAVAVGSAGPERAGLASGILNAARQSGGALGVALLGALLAGSQHGQALTQDNILQLRSILSAVAARGRQWVPVRMVPSGSFIELTDRDLEEVAIAEHTRWYRRRLAAGWTAAGEDGAARRKVRTNDSVLPWSELPPGQRAEIREYLRSQLAQLEDVGFVAIVPPGGPSAAASYQRIGVVQARKLSTRHTWTRRSGEELSGDAGDWRP